jgi:predicted RNase H-like HicB family nuclease
MKLTARIHEEGGSYWAEVVELPGCFASGATLDELRDALEEAVMLCRDDAPSTQSAELSGRLRIDEIKVLA